MVYKGENPIEKDDLGVPLFRKPPYWVIRRTDTHMISFAFMYIHMCVHVYVICLHFHIYTFFLMLYMCVYIPFRSCWAKADKGF